ncbi:MAG: alpha-2-macroglobulin, partial [Burkholderiales bacterium]|nr:alpha-2-macroglobulin [Burkholderiales bacterium]
LGAMLGERPYSLYTATMQGQVIGKRHFGRKAVPVGGGGGRSSTRELFDTLLLWKARVPLDANGNATVDVPLNDSLTSFRIVAVAMAGSDRFGTGQTSIRASKDVMLFSGLAGTVREDDKFEAAFTIRNTTTHPVQLNVVAKADGLPALAPQNLALDGGAAKELIWPVNVPIGTNKLNWTVEAKGEDGHLFDKLAVKQAVIESVPVRVLQATLTQLAPDYRLPIERPKDAIAGRGSVRVILSPSLAAALDGVEDYFRRYPYGCLEQLTSKAVGMNDAALWKSTVNRLDSYLDEDGFAKFFPVMHYGSPALTAHLLRLSAETGWELPEKGQARMQAALVAYLEGRTHFPRRSPNSTWEAADRLDMLSGLAPYGALRPTMLDGMVIEPNRWSNATLLDWVAVLDGLKDLPGRDAKLREARQILSARMDLSGTTLNFSTGMADDWWRELDSADTIGARMLIDALHHDNNSVDLGRVARGLAARQHRGHWDTTTGNAWGALAVREFAAKVEGGAPTGAVIAKLGGEQRLDWAQQPKGGTLDLPWPDKAGELTLQQQGNGKPWAVVQARSAVPLTVPLNAGYRVEKHWEPVEAKGKAFGRGDVWRVRLTIEAQADAGWVVVDDPIPAGSTLLGKGLGGESALLAHGEKQEGDWPAFEERGETAYHAYYEGMSKGTHVIEYTIRLGTRGEFRLPATHVEAMYAPERFGETPNTNLRID